MRSTIVHDIRSDLVRQTRSTMSSSPPKQETRFEDVAKGVERPGIGGTSSWR